MRIRKLLVILALLTSSIPLYSNIKTDNDLFTDIIIQTDSGNYSSELNPIEVNNEKYIWFKYYNDNEICHVILKFDPSKKFKSLSSTQSRPLRMILISFIEIAGIILMFVINFGSSPSLIYKYPSDCL